MTRWLILLSLLFAPQAFAQEQWCTDNAANCVCSDTFQSTSYTQKKINTPETSGAYLGDQVAPFKAKLYIGRKSFQFVEDQILSTILRHFNVTATSYTQIKEADLIAREKERGTKGKVRTALGVT